MSEIGESQEKNQKLSIKENISQIILLDKTYWSRPIKLKK